LVASCSSSYRAAPFVALVVYNTVVLVHGIGSDIQAFGYDEGAVAEREQAARRAEWLRMWRVYRQELFLNGDAEPFGVVEWKHTLHRIEIVRVKGR